MTFFSLLRMMNFDWEKAREVFYNLTDLQLAWIVEASKIMKKRMERDNRGDRHLGEVNVKSFDLRRGRLDARRR